MWWYNLGCISSCLVGFAGLAELAGLVGLVGLTGLVGLAGLGQFNYDEDMDLIFHPFIETSTNTDSDAFS